MPGSLKLIVLFSLITFQYQDMDDFKELKKADQVTLHKLEALGSNSDLEIKQIANRKVVSSIVLESSEKKGLIKSLRNKANYGPVSRRCRMEPTYALEIDGEVVALFDIEFCPRIQYLAGSKDILYDIKTENSMLKVMEEIYSN